MSAIDSLTAKFREFPGIGPRQAKRFVYFLLSRNSSYLDELSELIKAIKKEIRVCKNCFRFYNGNTTNPLCPICRNADRDQSLLMVVEKDIDLDNIEKSGAYSGYYFVLGGTVPILEKNPEEKVRATPCLTHVETLATSGVLKEVIFAFAVNAEGENTISYLTSLLKPLSE
jgi:recombination protein RecR